MFYYNSYSIGSFPFCSTGNNVKIATEEKGVKEVCNVLKIHMNSSEVAEAASASILALSLDGMLIFKYFV
jgi:hypothetical protein